jgi:hypothetical protein
MPRGKKDDLPVKKGKASKKVVEESEEEIDDEIIDEEPVVKKGSKKGAKTSASTAKKSSKKAKPAKDEDDEDELSEIDIDDEDAPDEEEEDQEEDHDEVVHSAAGHGAHQERPPVPRKVIDPKTPIGQLNIEDVLGHLINVGTETLNPQLKYGAINLLNQLTGRRRPFRPNNNGNTRGGFQQRGPGGNGPNGGGRGFVPRRNFADIDQDLYPKGKQQNSD